MTVFNASLLSMGVQNELKPIAMVIVLKYTEFRKFQRGGNLQHMAIMFQIHYGRFCDFWSENYMGVKTNEMGCFYLPNHCYQP